jgi:predicted nucleotide-binding protein (sugar kinase/HSP70/actin superfamily)
MSAMSRGRIGILKCLLYYPLYPFWHEFFRSLGYTTVVSPTMTGEAFDRGLRRFVGDICLPIESAFYHAEALSPEVDMLFVPHANRIHRDVYVCPACAGFPYVVAHAIPGLCPLLRINLSPYRYFDSKDLAELKRLGHSASQIRSAYDAACLAHRRFVVNARTQPDLDAAIAAEVGGPETGGADDVLSAARMRVLVLGMPYVLGDRFVSHGVSAMLAARGCRLVTPWMTAPEYADCEVTIAGYCLYWTLAGMSLVTVTRLLEQQAVDGVVYCSSFACGADSLLVPIVESLCRRCLKAPFTCVVLDEHAERGQLETRVEAFLDCVGTRVSRQSPDAYRKRDPDDGGRESGFPGTPGAARPSPDETRGTIRFQR